jgi:hypothetical protein
VALWLAKACAFSALHHAHVPCDVRIGVEVCVTVFRFFSSFPQGVVGGSRGCETKKKLFNVGRDKEYTRNSKRTVGTLHFLCRPVL